MASVCLNENQTNVKLSKDSADESPRTSDNSNADNTTLPTHLATILASVLEDASDQLTILGASLVPPTSIRIESVEERAKQFIAEDPIFDRETGDTFEEAFNRKKLLKLYYDSSKIMELLNQLENELKFDRNYGVLSDFMKEVFNSKTEENKLFNEENHNITSMIALKQVLQTEQKDSLKYICDLNEEIAVLKDETEDVLFENLLRTKYIDDWEKSRIEQNSLTCLRKEYELETTINIYKNEIDKETRVHNEIKLYIDETQKDMEKSIEYWIEKYNKDSETRKHEIAVLKEKRINLQTQQHALQEMYDLHEKQITDYLEYKERNRLEEERLALRNVKAIKLQAWWRGLMVRRQLGPFNPNKKGKGKKSKDDKAKKGKKK